MRLRTEYKWALGLWVAIFLVMLYATIATAKSPYDFTVDTEPARTTIVAESRWTFPTATPIPPTAAPVKATTPKGPGNPVPVATTAVPASSPTAVPTATPTHKPADPDPYEAYRKGDEMPCWWYGVLLDGQYMEGDLVCNPFKATYSFFSYSMMHQTEEGYYVWWLSRSRDLVCDPYDGDGNNIVVKGDMADCWVWVTDRPAWPEDDPNECGQGPENPCPTATAIPATPTATPKPTSTATATPIAPTATASVVATPGEDEVMTDALRKELTHG